VIPFRARNDHGLAPSKTRFVERLAHSVAKALRDLDFTAAGMHVGIDDGERPPCFKCHENRSGDIGPKGDRFAADRERHVIRYSHAAAPAMLSAMTASASSSADTPIQCRWAAGLMMTT
jgi:hypothetical protein